MNVRLEYGLRYQADVVLGEFVRGVITASEIERQLERYQLFGTVSPSRDGFRVVATFKGRSGTYTLPDSVRAVKKVA